MILFRPPLLAAALIAGAFASHQSVHAAIVYNEATDGAFSMDNTNPTDLGSLMTGTNRIGGTIAFGQDNIDFFTFVVPENTQVIAWDVLQYQSSDSLGFVGLALGTQFPFPVLPQGSMPGNQITGGSTFGLVNLTAGNSNILDGMPGNGSGIGFEGQFPDPIRLQPGTYTAIVQQLGDTTNYEFGLQVAAVPEPSGGLALAAIGVAAAWRRKR